MSITLMIQGTTSDAGKSTIVAGICRILSRRGLKVAPFKPQNMALNSAVTPDGLEIGRAQALQAVACGVPLQVEFNPVLLKPTTDKKAQVIILGKALSDMEAADYHAYKRTARAAVFEAYGKLQSTFDVIVVEGAGSPAEINLREGDIANMGFAEEADCPVLLVSDIDRGGVFAHCVGTLALLSESEQARTKGFIINKFRGDIALLQDGLDWLEARCDKKVVGVVPMVPALKLDAEDAIAEDMTEQRSVCRIAVLVFPRISNHTDFDPLRNHPDISMRYVGPGQSIPPCDLIILPGSKNVREDLGYLKDTGWDAQIARHCRYGGKVLGICGGFQMLGMTIDDPEGIESAAGSSEGLGLLPVSTTLRQAKQLKNVRGTIHWADEPVGVDGYEIHCGESFFQDEPETARPFSTISDIDGIRNDIEGARNEGAISSDGQVAGTYLHGLFESGDVVVALVRWVCGETVQAVDWSALREQELDRLADILEQSLDWDWLNHLLGIGVGVKHD